MTLTSFIYSAGILPRVEKASFGGLYRNLRQGREFERSPLQKNAELQWRNVKAMLEHAYMTVPFYKARFDAAGIRPEDVRAPHDMQRLPILTREDIRNNPDQLLSTNYLKENLQVAATGGTTDSPVPIYRDPACVPKRRAIQMQFHSWAGIHPGDKIFYLWGAVSDFVKDPNWKWRFYERHIMRSMFAPTSLLNESVLAEYANKLDNFRPKAIIAYPTPLAVFSEFLLSSGYKGNLPRTAVCTAEPLLPEQRKVIERALGCRVFELYGSRDFGMVAGECEMHDGLHLNPNTIFAEAMPLEGSDGLCEVIATDLLNPAFPLIRYRINDCVHPRSPQCACGRGFPLIGKIEGRVTDNFYLPNGSLVPGIALTNRVIKTASGIKKMQVIQERPELFVINYVPDASFDSSSLPNLRKKFVEFMGEGVEFQFAHVDEIKRERSGKTRLCISHVVPPSKDPINLNLGQA